MGRFQCRGSAVSAMTISITMQPRLEFARRSSFSGAHMLPTGAGLVNEW